MWYAVRYIPETEFRAVLGNAPAGVFTREVCSRLASPVWNHADSPPAPATLSPMER
jgi:hypothetical protein